MIMKSGKTEIEYIPGIMLKVYALLFFHYFWISVSFAHNL